MTKFADTWPSHQSVLNHPIPVWILLCSYNNPNSSWKAFCWILQRGNGDFAPSAVRALVKSGSDAGHGGPVCSRCSSSSKVLKYGWGPDTQLPAQQTMLSWSFVHRSTVMLEQVTRGRDTAHKDTCVLHTWVRISGNSLGKTHTGAWWSDVLKPLALQCTSLVMLLAPFI